MTRLKKLISATLALSLLGGSAAMAQPAHRDFGRDGNVSQDNRSVTQDNRGVAPNNRGVAPDNRGFRAQDNRGFTQNNRGGNFSFGFGYGPGVGPGFGLGFGPGYGYDQFNRGYGYGPGWRIGQYFSPYGAHYIVVNDWFRYHLRRPPIGYHWVRVNGDFLLVGITSGLIADLLLSQNYY